MKKIKFKLNSKPICLRMFSFFKFYFRIIGYSSKYYNKYEEIFLNNNTIGYIDYRDNTHAINFYKKKTFPIILKVLESRNLNEEV